MDEICGRVLTAEPVALLIDQALGERLVHASVLSDVCGHDRQNTFLVERSKLVGVPNEQSSVYCLEERREIGCLRNLTALFDKEEFEIDLSEKWNALRKSIAGDGDERQVVEKANVGLVRRLNSWR